MKANFDTLIRDTRPVIIDFHAEWCQPCKIQSPVLKEIASELGDRVRIIKIDVDRNPSIANRFSVQSVPTLMIFQHGEAYYKKAGVHDKHQLLQIINQII